MDISALGGGTVKLSGKNLNILCDPTTETVKNKAVNRIGVVTQSTEGLATVADAMVLNAPGEFEVGGAMITGVGARRHTDESGEAATMYSILLDGITVVVVGPVAVDFKAEDIERLGQVDVLVIPVGGHGLTLEPEEAVKLVAKFEPGYVIPVHYNDGITTYEMPQADLGIFLKEMGVSPEPIGKLKVNAREIPEETQVVVLTPTV